METRRIAGACFASGAVTLLMLLTLVPSLDLWALILATIAGATIGYLGYNIRQVIEVAVRTAKATVPQQFRGFWQRLSTGAVFCYQRPHRISTLLVATITAILVPFYLNQILVLGPDQIGRGLGCFVVGCLVWVVSCFLYYQMMIYLVIGRRETREKWLKRWGPWKLSLYQSDDKKAELTISIRDLLELHWNAAVNLFYFFLLGLYWSFKIVFWLLPVWVCRFTKSLYIQIHSDLRLLCAIDGPLGGFAAYCLLRQLDLLAVTHPLAQLGYVVLGGLIAAGIGVANHYVISVRVLRIAPQTVNH